MIFQPTFSVKAHFIFKMTGLAGQFQQMESALTHVESFVLGL